MTLSGMKDKNPALWLLIAIPVIGVTLSLVTVTAAIVTADEPIEVVDAPLSKTSWQDQPQDAP